jgi:hypothetical protein
MLPDEALKQAMNKERIETMFRNAGLVPVLRERIGNYDLFIADGFSNPPHFRFQHKFGIEPDQFPAGMHVTFWWIGDDDTLGGGRPIFIEPTESLQERLELARADARKYIKNRSLRKKH